MRVYVPATLASLRSFVDAGCVGPAPVEAFAVTPRLRESYVSGDAEDLEYVAMSDAARASLRQIAQRPDGPGRRVVLAVDVPDDMVRPRSADSPAAVRVLSEIPFGKVVSAHVDDPGAEGDVRAGAGSMSAAEAGEEDAAFLVDSVEDHELLWFAAQEIRPLLLGG